MNASEHISRVIGYLNEKADYAVLRNFEELPHGNKSRDIDIIITRKSLKAIRRGLIETLLVNGWQIVTYLNSDRLITYVCGRVDEERVELVQWDFFVDTSVFGIQLMSAEEFLQHKQFNGFLYYVGEECQFLDKYLYNRAVGAPYPEKYAATRAAAENSEVVQRKLKSLYGMPSAVACDKAGKVRLLLRALGYNMLRRPFGQTWGILNFLRTFVGNYLRSRTGFSVGFTGPDGSGKTTVIDLCIEKLGSVFRTAHVLYHFRPTLFGNLGEVAHAAGVKKEVDRDYSKPHRGGKTGKISSLIRLAYYSLDYILGYFLRVKTQTRITRLVIFDRYYTDIMADSRRSRIYLPLRFLYWFGKLFIPSPDYNILLTASAEHILARKRELDEEGIRSINEKLDYLEGKPGYKLFLNEGTPQQAVYAILIYLFAEQHKKNLKRING
ncbi:MAG: hypothetical protein Q4F40_02540 [Akkermansia sp.]|nr:hypothetical protein [Akkermansia sp.]